ncbi:lysozyme inhibitor LprI family protein [Prosthecobacter sp.]|uniref:lysozyme inhibitor LprI family protein n=1 Tax=Prosthecobacter sp. TaxID=1965333 RepID=UPI003783D5EB
MRNAISFFTLLLLTVCLSAGSAQDKPMSANEARAAFDKADHALNAAWAAARQALPETDFNKLKEDQRAWVEYRDYLARSPMYTGVDAQGDLALDSPAYLEAAAGLEDMRSEWLKGLIHEWKDEALTGYWTDSYGGSMEVVEREGHLHFVIQCVRGPTSHVGGLSGIAAWNSTIGWFSDKGRDKDKTDETNLSFILRDKKLEVIGANTGYYHGARAYFDGGYVKVKALDAKAQAKIVKAAKSGEVPEE